MNYKFTFILLFFLVNTSVGYSQILKFGDAEKLSDSINSASEESMPLMSNDGERFYFVRSFHEQNNGGRLGAQDIWMSQKNEFGWSLATNQLGVLNNKKNNALVGLAEDDQIMFLINSYSGKVHGVAFTELSKNKWNTPEKIQIKGISKEGFVGFYMNPSFDVLLISMQREDSYGEEDLYVSLKDSTENWSRPHNLGTTVNSTGFEITPFISRNKKYLFFASNGHPGFGDADIFVSERIYNNSWDVWSQPKNLGPVINSEKFDAYFSLSKDSVVYFSSNRDSDFADIYEASVSTQSRGSVQTANIDSVLNEVNALLDNDSDVLDRNIKELIVLFDYNKFNLEDSDKKHIDEIIKGINSINNIIVELNSFSFEDYASGARNLIMNQREEQIKLYLAGKGVSSADIISDTSLIDIFDNFLEDNIGGVRVKISY